MAIKKEYTKTVVSFDDEVLKIGTAVRLRLGDKRDTSATGIKSTTALYMALHNDGVDSINGVVSGYDCPDAAMKIQVITVVPGKTDRHLFWVSINDILRGYLDLEVL